MTCLMIVTWRTTYKTLPLAWDARCLHVTQPLVDCKTFPGLTFIILVRFECSNTTCSISCLCIVLPLSQAVSKTSLVFPCSAFAASIFSCFLKIDHSVNLDFLILLLLNKASPCAASFLLLQFYAMWSSPCLCKFSGCMFIDHFETKDKFQSKSIILHLQEGEYRVYNSTHFKEAFPFSFYLVTLKYCLIFALNRAIFFNVCNTKKGLLIWSNNCCLTIVSLLWFNAATNLYSILCASA